MKTKKKWVLWVIVLSIVLLASPVFGATSQVEVAYETSTGYFDGLIVNPNSGDSLITLDSEQSRKYFDVTYPYNSITEVESELNANDVYLRPTESIAYGEMWNWTENFTAWTFPIPVDSIYYNLTNLSVGNFHRFDYSDNVTEYGGSYLTVLEPNTYDIDASISFSSLGKGLYGIGVAKNFDITSSRNCYARRDIETHDKVGSVSLSCILTLDRFDILNVVVEDEFSPIQDILIHAVNLKVIQIKND